MIQLIFLLLLCSCSSLKYDPVAKKILEDIYENPEKLLNLEASFPEYYNKDLIYPYGSDSATYYNYYTKLLEFKDDNGSIIEEIRTRKLDYNKFEDNYIPKIYRDSSAILIYYKYTKKSIGRYLMLILVKSYNKYYIRSFYNGVIPRKFDHIIDDDTND